MKQPIFIAEVKYKSPFGYFSLYTKDALFKKANIYGDWISIHTSPKFGGTFDDISKFKNKTSKPILAKGFHNSNMLIQYALDCGADYVLTVDFLPDKKLRSKCLIEVSNINLLKKFVKLAPNCKYVCNSRNLDTGLIKDRNEFDAFRQIHSGWLCQASNIKTFSDIMSTANAYIVGENLNNFCSILDNKKHIN